VGSAESAMKSHCKTNITVMDKHQREETGAKIRRLSEAIILQAIEDSWIEEERQRCITFFTGEEFNICVGMAGMNFHDKVTVLNLFMDILRQNSETAVRISDTLENQTSHSLCQTPPC
jgi:hypothetical protein